MRLRRLVTALLLLPAAVATACAGDSELVIAEIEHDFAADQAAGLIGCSGGGPGFRLSSVTGPAPNQRRLFADAPGQALRAFLDNNGHPRSSGFIWSGGDWVVLRRDSDAVLYGYRSTMGLAYAVADAGSGAWKVRGYGGCGPRLLGSSTWQTAGNLDRAAPFMLVNYDSGSSCYSDDIVPVDHVDVTETDREVGLTVYLKKDVPPPGYEPPDLPDGAVLGCAGVGMTGQTRVELKAPLGNRELLDYGAVPHVGPAA